MSSHTFALQVFGGYGLSVLIETPVLMVGLSSSHSWGRRLFAGVWLTACTYPMVVLALPVIFPGRELRTLYLLVAETFAPLVECLLFWAVFDRPERVSPAAVVRDCAVIIAANLASFGAGALLFGWV